MAFGEVATGRGACPPARGGKFRPGPPRGHRLAEAAARLRTTAPRSGARWAALSPAWRRREMAPASPRLAKRSTWCARSDGVAPRPASATAARSCALSSQPPGAGRTPLAAPAGAGSGIGEGRRSPDDTCTRRSSTAIRATDSTTPAAARRARFEGVAHDCCPLQDQACAVAERGEARRRARRPRVGGLPGPR